MRGAFCESKINALRESVRASMSEYRFEHTAGVEKMAARLGELYAPDKIDVLRVAALLHDITKEKKLDGQTEILEHYGQTVSELECMSPAVLHSGTAALVIADPSSEYNCFASAEVISAVRLHTVGAPDMSLCDMLIYLADYIDETRAFDDCVALRNYFWDKDPENMGREERLLHLFDTLVTSFDLTIQGLIDEKKPISQESIATRNALLLRLKNKDFSSL